MSIYERLIAGEVLRVRFKAQTEYAHKVPFSLERLLMMGPNHYVKNSSEWARFAKVGGITINKRKRHRMGQEEMQFWCSTLEEVGRG